MSNNINKVTVIGTGVIGAGWIIRCLAHNKKVVAFDKDLKLKKRLIAEIKRTWPYVKKLFNKKTLNLKNFKYVTSIEESLKDADFILATTISNKMKTLDYMPILELALKKNIPLICANPDFETLENDSLTICMGTIAELYKSLGGNIFILGKPKKDIYIESTKQIIELDKSKILAVGDSIYHDIQGANSFGVDSLLITSGIHQSSFDVKKPMWETKIN